MSSYNRIILVGNLTRDPQLSYTPNNVAVCKFGLATNRRRKDADGNMREEVCYVDCTVFARGAETFNQYMAKGRSILIEGRLQFQQWTNPEGQKRSKHEVIVENFQFLGAAAGRGPSEETQAGAAPVQAPATGPAFDQSSPPPGGPAHDQPPPPTDNDIPF